MPPESPAHAGYVAAFREIAARVAASLAQAPLAALPIQMYVAGGAALHFHTGGRVSADVDATFSRLIALPDGLHIAWRDDDGSARLLYFDRQYNDTFGLKHEDAYADSIALALEGIDPRVLEVRILTPLDLAVSKLGRYSAQDRADIATLAERGLLAPVALENRALQALGSYVGDTRRLRGNISDAVRLVADTTPRSAAGRDTRHPK